MEVKRGWIRVVAVNTSEKRLASTFFPVSFYRILAILSLAFTASFAIKCSLV
ncbi:MAG TPA: hypothetical protein PKZ30_06940 [Defluviitoga tunisiensis]|nr:hypothetical protein [Defluviitoga tunisiensis]